MALQSIWFAYKDQKSKPQFTKLADYVNNFQVIPLFIFVYIVSSKSPFTIY